MQGYIKDLLKKLSGRIVVTPEAFHFLKFIIEDGELHYIGAPKPLMKKGVLLPAGDIAKILGKNRLRELGFNVPRDSKITAKEFILMNISEKIPSVSAIARADDIELKELTENASRSIENLSQRLEGEDLPMHELLGLDKQLRSIRDSLKVEVAKKVQLE